MATANFFAPGFDDQVEQQNIERQRKMADLLRQQSAEPMQNGSMVSGHYVAPSFTQGLAKLLQGYNAGKMGEEADAKQKALAEAVKGRAASEYGQFTDLLAGRKADVLPEDQAGPVRAAQPGDIEGAYRFASRAQTPALQQVGMTGATRMAEEQTKQVQAKAEQQRVLGILQSAKTPQEAIAAGVPAALVTTYFDQGLGKEKGVVVNGQLVNPLTGAPIGNPIAKQADLSNDLLIPDGKGGMMVNQPLLQAKQQVAAAGRAPAAERQVQTIQTDQGTMERVNGKWVPITGPDGKPVLKAGAVAGADKPLTEGQAKGSLYLGQMRGATKELENLETAGGTRKAQSVASPAGVAAAGSTWTNWATSKEAQKVAQIQNQWSEAFLRAKTGAAATPGEVELNNRTFFPVFGEDKETSAQKAKMRKQAEADMEFVAGRGAAKAGLHPEGSWDTPPASPAPPAAAPSVRGGPMQKPVKPASVSNW
jgi:hypothetical protein